MSALGRGLSVAGYAAGEMFAKGALMDQQSELETQKALRLAEFQEQMAARGDRRKLALAEESAERSRTGQVARIDAKAGELADSAVGEKRGLIDAGIADRSLWTAEQQATVDQSLANDRKALVNDPATKTRAAMATGDISPKDAAAIERDERRLDATDKATSARERAAEMRDATQRYIADLRHEDSQKRLDVLISKIGAKDAKDRPTEAIKFIDGLRKELADDARDTRTLLKEELASDKYMDDDKKQAIRDKYEPKLADIDRKRTQLEKDFNSLRERVGLPAIAAEPTPTAAPKPANRPPLSSFQKK